MAYLVNPTNPYYASTAARIQPIADQLGIQLLLTDVSTPPELDQAFPRLVQRRADAVLVSADAFLYGQRQRVAELALKSRLPSMSPFAEAVEAGALMSYGIDTFDGIRRQPTFIDRIFRGAKPSEIPIEQPTRVYLVINRTTANALALTIPPSLLLQAEKVIG